MKRFWVFLWEKLGIKIAIILGIAAVCAVIVIINTWPRIWESALESITLEDGTFYLDDLRPGMTMEEVEAALDQRNLVYISMDTETMVDYSTYGQIPYTHVSDISWISLADETRVSEMGNITVRRTYYFRHNELSHVELQATGIHGRVDDDVARFQALAEAMIEAYGPCDFIIGDAALADRDMIRYTWHDDHSALQSLRGPGIDLIAKRYPMYKYWGNDFTKEPKVVEYFEFTLRIRVMTHEDAVFVEDEMYEKMYASA